MISSCLTSIDFCLLSFLTASETALLSTRLSFSAEITNPDAGHGARKLKTYLITDDEYKDIYERLEDGEPGEHVGKLTGKQNKPFFF